MMQLVGGFLRDNQAQDLVEYTLLLAMVCLASVALFIGGGEQVAGIWNNANTRIQAANTSAGS